MDPESTWKDPRAIERIGNEGGYLGGETGVQRADFSSLISKTPSKTAGDKCVYQVLAEHQVTETWELRDLLAELHRWADIFNTTFDLRIPAYSLCVDWLRGRRLGHFRSGHNG